MDEIAVALFLSLALNVLFCLTLLGMVHVLKGRNYLRMYSCFDEVSEPEIVGVCANNGNVADTTGSKAIQLDLLPLFLDKCKVVAQENGLSEREEDVLALYARGKSINAVAEELCITKSTVKTHAYHIYQKLGIHNRDELLEMMEGVCLV